MELAIVVGAAAFICFILVGSIIAMEVGGSDESSARDYSDIMEPGMRFHFPNLNDLKFPPLPPRVFLPDHAQVVAFLRPILTNPIDRTSAAVLRDWLEDNKHPLFKRYNSRYEKWLKWDEDRGLTSAHDKYRVKLADRRFQQWVRAFFYKYRE